MKIKKISNEIIDLDNFDRRQEVKHIYVNENNKCVLKDQVWTMDWSLERKREVAADLLSHENISYAAYDSGRIVGFVSVVKKLIGHRMVLDMIQVDRTFRGQGIGRQLFCLAVAEAKNAGAKELYISACCSEETVNFYKAMGAKVTNDPIPAISKAEPYDIQMICPIMKIVDFFKTEQQDILIAKIAEGEWRAAKFLAKLLRESTFQKTLGGGTVYLLMEGENIVSFVTLTQQDCITDETLYPWLGFFFTFPEYRGNRYGGKLLAYAAEEARKQGYQKVYLATDHIGLYEKYGFTYLENRIDVYGEDSRIYAKNL